MSLKGSVLRSILTYNFVACDTHFNNKPTQKLCPLPKVSKLRKLMKPGYKHIVMLYHCPRKAVKVKTKEFQMAWRRS